MTTKITEDTVTDEELAIANAIATNLYLDIIEQMAVKHPEVDFGLIAFGLLDEVRNHLSTYNGWTTQELSDAIKALAIMPTQQTPN
jgi:hypothetical protein